MGNQNTFQCKWTLVNQTYSKGIKHRASSTTYLVVFSQNCVCLCWEQTFLRSLFSTYHYIHFCMTTFSATPKRFIKSWYIYHCVLVNYFAQDAAQPSHTQGLHASCSSLTRVSWSQQTHIHMLHSQHFFKDVLTCALSSTLNSRFTLVQFCPIKMHSFH